MMNIEANFDAEFAAINIEHDAFHGEWNYSIGSG